MFVKMAVLHEFFMSIGNCLHATYYMLAMLEFRATRLPNIYLAFPFFSFQV